MRIISQNFILNKELYYIRGYFFHFNTNDSSLFNIKSTSKILIIKRFYKYISIVVHNGFNKERISINNEHYVVYKKKKYQKKSYTQFLIGNFKENKKNTYRFISNITKKYINIEIENKIDTFLAHDCLENKFFLLKVDD